MITRLEATGATDIDAATHIFFDADTRQLGHPPFVIHDNESAQ